MGVKHKPARFVTSDGCEWSSEQEATKRQDLLDAERNYNQAAAAYGQKLAETQLTADGEPFEWGVFSDYWFPTCWADGRPTLRRLSVIGRDTAIEDGAVKIIPYQEGPDRKMSFKVNELFRRERNARLDLLKRLEKYRDDVNSDIERLRAELGK